MIIFDEIDSTNTAGLRIARTIPDANYVIVAKHQTQSRGRSYKTWQSYFGNLHCSILLKHNIALNYLPQLSFVTAVAVHKAIYSLSTQSLNNIQLKWPNDVLINQQKVGGILLESISIEKNHYLVIGIGINVKHSPSDIDQLTTNLCKENIAVKNLEYLLDLIMNNFDKYFTYWQNHGFHKIRQYWCRRAYNINQIITVNSKNTKITGIFKGIDLSGRLEILSDSGETIRLLAD